MTTYTDFGDSLLVENLQPYDVKPTIVASSDSECDDRSSSGVSSSSSLSSLGSQTSSGISSNKCSKYHRNLKFVQHNVTRKAKVCSETHRIKACSKHHMDSTTISSHILGERPPCIGQETSPFTDRFLNDIESSLKNHNIESKHSIDVSLYMLNPEAHVESVTRTSALTGKKQHNDKSKVQKITKEDAIRSLNVNNLTGIIRDMPRNVLAIVYSLI
jgi:hypothetical protein